MSRPALFSPPPLTAPEISKIVHTMKTTGKLDPPYKIPPIWQMVICVKVSSHEEIISWFNDTSTDYSQLDWEPRPKEYGNPELMHAFQAYQKRQLAIREADYRVDTELKLVESNDLIVEKSNNMASDVMPVVMCIKILQHLVRVDAQREHERKSADKQE